MTLAMRMLLAGLLLVLAATAGATAQVPDRVFIEGRDDALDQRGGRSVGLAAREAGQFGQFRTRNAG